MFKYYQLRKTELVGDSRLGLRIQVLELNLLDFQVLESLYSRSRTTRRFP